MTTSRRDFIRRGALWVAGAALVEPVAKKLWAFPTNPLGNPFLSPPPPPYRLPTAVRYIEVRHGEVGSEISYDEGKTWVPATYEPTGDGWYRIPLSPVWMVPRSADFRMAPTLIWSHP